MLFREDALERIRSGRVSVVFRRWRTARVRAGTRLRTMIGLIEVRAVTRVPDVLPQDTAPAGYADLAALRADIPGDPAKPLYRIEVGYAGADPRIALREDVSGLAAVATAVERMDRSARRGPWTRTVLGLVAARPATRAADLYAEAGYPDLASFKRDVRRLKELGLTESLEIGYRLSPRGRALLDGS
ncbi:hypothetical protein [Krasilnikovia sp. MM14-A1004]|uniref:hypothetical protein n=1 Tax=Krasilnikovia sp. MM14-A1004 TaxID=3373541 RepID=UPI00399CF22D